MPNNRPVLVVDDDEAILELVEMALDLEGRTVVPARDGRQALALLDSVEPALILLDMRMPVMNGWQFVASYRRAAARPAPIVVMTAGKDAAATAAEIEADAYLGKPFDLEELLAIVRQHTCNGRH